jgi:hypothetical protein
VIKKELGPTTRKKQEGRDSNLVSVNGTGCVDWHSRFSIVVVVVVAVDINNIMIISNRRQHSERRGDKRK